MLRFPWYSWDLRWITSKDLTLSSNTCTETRLWCVLWCHWAHVCSVTAGLPWDKAQKNETPHSPHSLLGTTQFPDGIIIMPSDPIDTPQLSHDDIILLFILLEIHEKRLSWMCFWLWESGEKAEIPQNNKVFLCDPLFITEVWLFFFFFFLRSSLIPEAHKEFCLPHPTTVLWWTSQTDWESEQKLQYNDSLTLMLLSQS